MRQKSPEKPKTRIAADRTDIQKPRAFLNCRGTAGNDHLLKAELSLTELWNISIKFLWNDEFVSSLDRSLRAHGVKTVLDAAGGTGFPCLELGKLGWNVSYSDASEAMFGSFKNRIAESGVQIPCYLSNWLELTKRIPKKFDAVLCRGNSLIYVDSWDGGKPAVGTKDRIRKALAEFYGILNPGGLLYVDIINESEFDRANYPIIEDMGEKTIDGKRMKLTWEVVHDYEKKVRTVTSHLSIDGSWHEYVYSSYLLRHNELVDMLKEAGFRRVEKTEIEGENSYSVFITYK